MRLNRLPSTHWLRRRRTLTQYAIFSVVLHTYTGKSSGSLASSKSHSLTTPHIAHTLKAPNLLPTISSHLMFTELRLEHTEMDKLWIVKRVSCRSSNAKDVTSDIQIYSFILTATYGQLTDEYDSIDVQIFAMSERGEKSCSIWCQKNIIGSELECTWIYGRWALSSVEVIFFLHLRKMYD